MEKLGKQINSEDKYSSVSEKDMQGAGEDTTEENQKEKQGVEKKTKYNKMKSFLSRKDNLILVILGGILLMIIALPGGTKQETLAQGENTLDSGTGDTYYYDATGKMEDDSDYQSGIEKRLEKLLLQTESCENVRVMITFKEGKNDVSGKYDYCFTYPEISGIVVCINEGDDPNIAEKVTAYIQALFSIEAHKIRVANIKTSAYGG